ncbi:MAG: murein hydrolase activator EnvC family protein [Actinomycetota bacterium]
MSNSLRFAAAAIAVVLGAVLLPTTAGLASPPNVSPTPAATSGGGGSADQAAAAWNGFRTAQLQAEVLQTQINQEKSKAATLQSRVASYTTQIAAAQARQAADAAQVSTTDGQLTQIEASIVTTTAKATSLQGTVEARIVALYQQGPVTYLASLLSAKSLGDFLERAQYVGSVLGNDRSKLNDLEQVGTTLTGEQSAARQHRAQIASAESAEAAEGAKLVSLRSAVAQASAAIPPILAAEQGQLAQVDAEKATYEADMAEQAGEASSLTAFVQDHQANEAFTWSGKKVIWPVKGPISSPFGPRIDPIFHVPSFHTGLDIAVDTGTPIAAAAAGKVIYSGQMEGYGNVVILDHGGAFATLYAHMSVIKASLGQSVAQGQTIGLVGCTGLCTGPHLHFETRVGGAPVNPLTFLP